MDRAELSRLIESSLLRDINLTEEEYKKKRHENDNQTKNNGVEGKASLSETVRSRRMAMNFYGTVLNVLLNIHASNLEMLAAQNKTNLILEKLLGDAIENTNNGE